jgi:hypothetical protein
MSDNYEARFVLTKKDDTPLFSIFTKVILQAWDAREELSRDTGESLVLPRIVSGIKQKLAETMRDVQDDSTKQQTDVLVAQADLPVPIPADSSCHGLFYGMGGQGNVGSDSQPYYGNMSGQTALEIEFNDLNWTPMDWNPLYRGEW